MSLMPGRDPLFVVFLITVFSMFLVVRLDTVSDAPPVRQFIINILNNTTAYMPINARPWTPVSCMWIHGSFFHLINNLAGIVLFAWCLSKAYGPRAWRKFCFAGSYLGALGHCLILNEPAADFAHWHGPLVSIFYQAKTPLAGASVGAMAMMGATTTAALLYWLTWIWFCRSISMMNTIAS